MKLIGTQPLETERFLLRRFVPEDAEAMFRNWANDPEVTRYLRWEAYRSVDEAKETICTWLREYESPSFLHWAMCLKPGLEPIGSIGIVDRQAYDERAEIGYCIGRRWWGRGLTAEALRAVLAFGFEAAGYNRLSACHSLQNPASGRVMEKAGMLLEGTLRQYYRCSSGFQDCRLYAMLRQDYLAAHQSSI